MEQVIKTFLSVFIAMILMFICVAVTNVAIQSKNADVALDTAAAQWEASNYRLSQAELQTIVNNPAYTVTLAKSTSASNKNTSYAVIKLSYKVTVPFIGLELDKETSRSLR